MLVEDELDRHGVALELRRARVDRRRVRQQRLGAREVRTGERPVGAHPQQRRRVLAQHREEVGAPRGDLQRDAARAGAHRREHLSRPRRHAVPAGAAAAGAHPRLQPPILRSASSTRCGSEIRSRSATSSTSPVPCRRYSRASSAALALPRRRRRLFKSGRAPPASGAIRCCCVTALATRPSAVRDGGGEREEDVRSQTVRIRGSRDGGEGLGIAAIRKSGIRESRSRRSGAWQTCRPTARRTS